MMSRPFLFGWILAGVAAVLLLGCSEEKTTVYIYQAPGTTGNFPGTPASASNLAEDAKALSPGGQDVTAVRVFWDGHDSQRAVVLFETRVYLAEQEDVRTNTGPPATTTTTTMKMYFRHLWATFFDGAKLTKPVEIVGKNMEQMVITQWYVTVNQQTLVEVDSGWRTAWQDLTDTAAVLFYRPSATGAFNADPSSAKASARSADAVILFRARDTDTETAVNLINVSNERIGMGDGAQTNFGGRFARAPIVSGTVSVTDGTETFTDNGNGTLTGDQGGNGFVDYGSGGFYLIFNAAVGNGTAITASYTKIDESNANERLYYSYFDRSQAGLEWAETEDVVGTGPTSKRVFRWGFMEEAKAINGEIDLTAGETTVHNVSSFGVLADGFMGQAWWDKDDNDLDPSASYTHFLVAVWTEMIGGYTTGRGVFDKFMQTLSPGNEIDMKLMAAVFNVEDATFGASQEIEPDTGASENNGSIPVGILSDGDTWLHEGFITYDNQIFFTYVDCPVDDDPWTAPNWDHHAGNEIFDSALNWNIFTLAAQTTTGAGTFFTNSTCLSPAFRAALINVDTAGATGVDMPDCVGEFVNELKDENGKVVYGADEGLGATYIFFTHQKSAANLLAPFPSGFPVDDTDLYVAQIRHLEPVNFFTPNEDLLEVDTLGDTITVMAENNSAMNFTAPASPSDNRLNVGASNNGPTFDEWPISLVTAGSDTRLVFRFGGVGSGNPAFATLWGVTYYDEDFSGGITDQTATVEDYRRGVQKDWRVVLNNSSEHFLILFRQQDRDSASPPLGPSLGVFGGNVMSVSGDIGLYASRLTTVLDGGTPQALSGLAQVGNNAVRLDNDVATTDPTAGNQYRQDAIGFLVQRELEPYFRLHSDPNRINVLFVTIEDDNPAVNDARNTLGGDHSYDLLKVVQVENGASLTLHPGQGGAEVARMPFGYLTDGGPGTTLQEDLEEKAAVLDAGVNGDALVYFMKPTATEVQIVGVFTLPSPAGVRLFVANFNGTATLTTRQISSDAYDPELLGDNYAKHQVLGFIPPFTRAISPTAAGGLYHLILWIEDRTASATFLGGGALMSLRYNKAVPESGSTSSRLVSAADAFTPSITGSSGWPVQADFKAGDSISFPFGFGMVQATLGLYFTQFGEIYYTEYSPATGNWWVDAAGLPAPTLLSNEGFPGMPNAFLEAISGEESDMYGAQVFSNMMLQEFTATVGGADVLVRRYDSFHKALVLYAKDDGGWDPEDDGTGFNRLFCRIRN